MKRMMIAIIMVAALIGLCAQPVPAMRPQCSEAGGDGGCDVCTFSGTCTVIVVGCDDGWIGVQVECR